MTAPTVQYPTPVTGTLPAGGGLIFPSNGAGLVFDAGYPLTFPPGSPGDLSALFPTIMPQVERIVYDTVNNACQACITFPAEGQGLGFPVPFRPPLVSLFRDKDGSYTIPVGLNAGEPIPQIPVYRSLSLPYPGNVPAIGVGASTTSEASEERTIQSGFAGDVYAIDSLGNILATASYYSEPLRTQVVVELIHENRDERDRLHDQLWRVLLPLRQQLGESSAQVFDVTFAEEKQDLPLDKQPRIMYVSVFTVEVAHEALVAQEIVAPGVIEQVTSTVTPTQVTPDAPTEDLT